MKLSEPSLCMAVRRRVRLRGIVQGVGLRPFIYRLATALELSGHVVNRGSDVELEVEGSAASLDRFVAFLRRDAPPPVFFSKVQIEPLEPRGDCEFRIDSSRAAPSLGCSIPPDLGTCDECLRELDDPQDRRFRYPFTNCTRCGPRLTIVRALPYDRERTAMSGFEMCVRCRDEYEDPADRRFHAEPIACPTCGPRARLLGPSGDEIVGEEPIRAAADRLMRSAIIAVKGLGGYHLAVDARDERAVLELRTRKQRDDKPMAVMARDLAIVRSLCDFDEHEERLLTGWQRPIVLLRRREPSVVAEAVTRGHRFLGVMLPYTPLHHLLLSAAPLLVLTSGNSSDRPIVCDDREALTELAGIADYFLVHDRPIEIRCDDSVVHHVGGRNMILRRSRGYVPDPIAVAFEFPQPILSCGAHLKSTFCLGVQDQAIVGPHIGDLEDYQTLRSFESGIDYFKRLLSVNPRIIAHDLHPGYLSTQYAHSVTDARLIGVQHHHAHIASVMAEHRLDGRVIGVAFDGTGYGSDGTIWGGEFLVAEYGGFTRAAHLEYTPMPGGEAAVREPWRMAAAWLNRAGINHLPAGLDTARWETICRMVDKKINCPPTSSMGRLFDAVSFLVTGRAGVSYEGQAAVELETLAGLADADRYEFGLAPGEPDVVEGGPVMQSIVTDLRAGIAPAAVASGFHSAVAAMIVQVCARARERYHVGRVALSGGVFQNAILLERTLSRLERSGFEVYINERVPPNDGGISLGQAAVAAAVIGSTACA